MKHTIFISILLFYFISSTAQVVELEEDLKKRVVDTVAGWKSGGVVNFNLSQTSFTNWAAGGQNSISMNGFVSLHAKYKKGKSNWENYLDVAYGSIKQKSVGEWWKTDDKIDFTSKYGRKASKQWYFAGLINFKTQMADGYNYPDTIKISTFMAPGYLLGAAGMDYKPMDEFSAFIAPITSKTTFVMDQSLADSAAFGVDPGENIYAELGGYVRLSTSLELMENITVQSKLDFFTNYLHNPQNIDISWEALVTLKVNKYISASISTHLLYDDDIDIEVLDDNGKHEGEGPRLQFKEVIGVGLMYKFQ